MIDKLRRLGLTSYEAKIYVSLLEYGQLDAKKIAEFSGVPPTAVYPNLNSLLEKDIIQKFEGDVANFSALKPSIALSALMENKKKELNSLEKELVEQAERIQNKKEIISREEIVQVSLGKQSSIKIYYDFMTHSKKTFYIIGWHMRKVRDKYILLREFKKMIKRGVDVRIISIGKPNKEWDVVKAYLEAGIRIKYIPLENFSIIISDGKECKITLKSRDLPKKINIKINDAPLSEAMQHYFLSVWKKANLLRISD